MRNETASLPALIDSIRAQTRQPEEVILVDGGSTDGTPELARTLTQGDARFRLVEAGPASPGRGRNVGIEVARCDWIALTDAGIRLEPTWLERLTEVALADPLADPLADVVYGHYEPETDTFFTECAKLAYTAPLRIRPEGRMRGPFIASSLLRRRAWERVGGFPDERAAEDLVFMEALERSGCVIRWAPAAVAHWQLQPNLARTFRRFCLYSRHNVWLGRQRDWHYGVARKYAVALPCFVLAGLHHPSWALLPLLGHLLRTVRSILAHSEGRALTWALNPCRLGLVAAILLTVDAATFSGWLQAWTRPGKLRRGRGAGP